MPAAHAEIGGSTIGRIIECPASVNLIADLTKSGKIIPGQSSAAADRGSLLHEAIAHMYTKKLSAEALVGYTAFNQSVTQQDARGALVPAMHALKVFTQDTSSVKLEHKVRFPKIPNAWGTADILGLRGDEGLVGDFKFGSGIIAARDNPQMLFYAAAALECRKLPANIAQVTLGIIQPAARNPLHTYTVPIAQVREFGRQVASTAKQAKRKDLTVNPGKHCLWCPARQNCRGGIESQIPPATSAAILKHLNKLNSTKRG